MTIHGPDLARGMRATFGRSVGIAGDRTMRFLCSSFDVARDGHKICRGAWQSKGHDGLSDFKKSGSPMTFGHKLDEPLVGNWLSMAEVDDGLEGIARFATVEQNPLAETLWAMYRDDVMRAVSVSWEPVQYRYATDKGRAPGSIDFQQVSLLECALVSVPADVNAVARARSLGIDTQPLASWAARRLDEKDFARMSRHDLELIERTARADAARRKVYPGAAQAADGFSRLGEFLQAVAHGVSDMPGRDARLRTFERGPSGGSEVDPAAGGFAVPPTFLEEIVGSIYADSVLGGLIDKRETDQALADVKLPAISETTRQDGGRLGGVISFWSGEGVQPPSNFPRWRNLEFSSKKLVTVVNATSELVGDVPMFESYFREVIASEFGYRLDQSVITGSGAGVPLGVVSGPGTITVPKASGQTPGTIVAENLSSMWARLPGPLRRRAVWVGNSDVETQLENMSSSATFPGTYMPAGADGDTSPRIKGRPLLISEASPALGTPGDLVLIDPQSYLLISNPIRFAMSVHARWISDECVFRVVWRVDGKPKYATPVTPANGGAQQSAFVALAAR